MQTLMLHLSVALYVCAGENNNRCCTDLFVCSFSGLFVCLFVHLFVFVYLFICLCCECECGRIAAAAEIWKLCVSAGSAVTNSTAEL